VTDILIRRGLQDTNTHRPRVIGRHREKAAIYKPRRKASAEASPDIPWPGTSSLHHDEKRYFWHESCSACGICYRSARKLIHFPWSSECLSFRACNTLTAPELPHRRVLLTPLTERDELEDLFEAIFSQQTHHCYLGCMFIWGGLRRLVQIWEPKLLRAIEINIPANPAATCLEPDCGDSWNTGESSQQLYPM
jgi:hypothetical protein